MIDTSNTQYPYEHYGDIAVDFGSTYWENLTNKYVDTSKWRAVGFEILVHQAGKFFMDIWVTPLDVEDNEKEETPIKKIKTNITWEEFSNSFVVLQAQAFWGRQTVDKFYDIDE